MKVLSMDKHGAAKYVPVDMSAALAAVAPWFPEETARGLLESGKTIETPTHRYRADGSKEPPAHDRVPPPDLKELREAGVVGWWG